MRDFKGADLSLSGIDVVEFLLVISTKFSLSYSDAHLQDFAESNTKAIRVRRSYDACFRTNKNFDARVSAGVVVACTLPQSSTDIQDDDHGHPQSLNSAVKTTIPL